MLTLLIDILIKTFLQPLIDIVNEFVFVKGSIGVFYFESMTDISQDIIDKINMCILVFAISLLSCKLLYKLFNVYILGIDGDNSTSPLEYLKSYAKGIFISLTFTVFYGWLVDIAQSLTTSINNILAAKEFDFMSIIGISPVMDLFVLAYVVSCFAFLITLLVSGVRMMFLRISIPLACVGLIDNDNGIYSTFIKLLIQTTITAMAQIFLIHLSFLPIKFTNGDEYSSILSLVFSSAILMYAFKLPSDLNLIFFASPTTGAGQKLSAIGRGIQMAASMIKR